MLLCRAAVAEEEGDPVAAERLARQAHAAARAASDGDLELCALSARGSALVAMGRVKEGVALLDEAMAGSLGGEVDALDTVVMTSCQTIICCNRGGEFERAGSGFGRRTSSIGVMARRICTRSAVRIRERPVRDGRWEEEEGSRGRPEDRQSAASRRCAGRLSDRSLSCASRRDGSRRPAADGGVAEHPAGVPGAAGLGPGRGGGRGATLRRLGDLDTESLEGAALLELLAAAQSSAGPRRGPRAQPTSMSWGTARAAG